ncbi:DsbC family protein [Polaromonas sp. JS666]|uniref:DsbC family protein n=1 Tax=Polaromonas sp. (strain JS666 / ATCC BAA-500) TaxID=296591 RepID=UPI0000464D07|nr:DsbC family protein [Polaromonas sp. JS666]ABE45413.1 thiol:disulfide interchange protein DsbC [Polaromonas sp. JS666]
MMERLLMVIAAATVATVARSDDAAVRATLQRTFPQSPIQSPSKTPVPGVLEAAIEGQIIYITEDGQYVLGGPLLDVKASRNLTEVRLEQINAIPFDSLPLDWAFKRVKGTGARRIAIFEDPDCPYCKMLEQTLEGMDNLTVYVFLYPIDQIHPDAVAKSKAVWCAKDRVKAWDDAMRPGTVPTGAANCDNPIAKIIDFAKRHRITGTPTTILADGRRLVGAVPRAELEAQLQKAAKR